MQRNLDLAGLRLGAEKGGEVRAALNSFLDELEICMMFPSGADVDKASLEMQLVVEGVPIRVSVPFSLTNGEQNEEHSRLQGFPSIDVTASLGSESRPQD